MEILIGLTVGDFIYWLATGDSIIVGTLIKRIKGE